MVNEPDLTAYVGDRDLSALERLCVDVGTHAWPDPAENDGYRASCARVAAVLATRLRRFRGDVIDGGEHHEATREARLGAALGFLHGR